MEDDENKPYDCNQDPPPIIKRNRSFVTASDVVAPLPAGDVRVLAGVLYLPVCSVVVRATFLLMLLGRKTEFVDHRMLQYSFWL